MSTHPAEYAWFAALVILGAYELYALTTGNMTLSRLVWTAERSQYGTLIPFLTGMLMGHFFWSGR